MKHSDQPRDARTMAYYLGQWIDDGTWIITDGWRAYPAAIRTMVAQGRDFTHGWVNHVDNFVDPNDPRIRSQQIEARWGAVKRTLKQHTSRNLLPTYLFQYMFRVAHKDDPNNKLMKHLLFWIRHKY